MPLPLPASTVAIISDGVDGIDVLMVKRSKHLASAAGAWVFPGGRVEDEDYADTDDHHLAAQCAAVRETIEETGVCLDKQSLISFAHWTTPEGPPRRYATWFFLTSVDAIPLVTVDGSEIIDHCWLSPAQILQRHRNGEMEITPPGFVTLTRLSKFNRTSDALRTFSKQGLTHYNPRLAKTDTGRVILYEGDVGYHTCDISADGNKHRIVIDGNHWHYQTPFDQ